MIIPRFRALILGWIALTGLASAAPNFIVILTDDQGWGTTSAVYDPEYPDSQSDFFETPNLERLMERGLRFTQAYSAHPNCSPSRAALLTGMSPAALHFTDICNRNTGALYEGNPLIPPQHINDLPEQPQTIPELLKAKDPSYVAALFGKWHLSGGGPKNHGFDASDGRTGNWEGNLPKNLPDDPKQCFGITKRAIAWMQEQAEAERPFYLQVNHYATHLGSQSLKQTREKFAAKPKGERHQSLPFAAMIYDMDQSIGQLLDAIDAAGLAEETYIFYTADNGTYPTKDAGNINGPLQGSKASIWEGGVRVPFVVAGPSIPIGAISREPVVGYDILPTICSLAGLDSWPDAVEGGNLAPLWNGMEKVERPRDYLVFHWPHYQHQKFSKPDSTIIKGNLKLHYWWETEETQLFDLSKDIAEGTDLSAERPEVASELQGMLFNYLEAVNAQLPKPNPDYDPAKDPSKPKGKAK